MTYEVIVGPSRHDLMWSLFKGQPVCFILKEFGNFEVQMDLVSPEDSKGNRTFYGTANGQQVEGIFHTFGTGWLVIN